MAEAFLIPEDATERQIEMAEIALRDGLDALLDALLAERGYEAKDFSQTGPLGKKWLNLLGLDGDLYRPIYVPRQQGEGE